MIVAIYTSGKSAITIVAVHKETAGPVPVLVREKGPSEMEVYLAGKTTHYLFQNSGNQVATWCTGSMECIIKGDLTEAEIKKMVDSIYEK